MTMSSKEAADRIGARGTRGRQGAPARYRCESCGSTELVVERHYYAVHTWVESIPCECGEGDPTTRTCRQAMRRVDRFELGEDHRPGELIDSQSDPDDIEPDNPDYGCADCFADAVEERTGWHAGEVEIEGAEEEDVYVRCGMCDHVIEFG